MELAKVLGQGLLKEQGDVGDFIITAPTDKSYVTSTILICSSQEDDGQTEAVETIEYSAHIVPNGEAIDLVTFKTRIINRHKIEATDTHEVDFGSIVLGDGDSLHLHVHATLDVDKLAITVMGVEVT
jgi:hypothetical protein